MVTLDRIREPEAAELYPRGVLEGCETALVLFAAAFHGKQDAVWIADAGLKATCVDIDRDRLGEMAALYPADWKFYPGDVFKMSVVPSPVWDIVSLDPSTNLFDRCAEMIDVWCSLARHAVILGCGAKTDIVSPDGWRKTDMRFRSRNNGGTYWAVLERVRGSEEAVVAS